MPFSVIRSVLAWLLLVATGQGSSAQEAVNKFHIHAGSALNGTEEFTVSMTTKGFLLWGTSHLQRGDLVLDLHHAENIGADGKFASYKLEGTRLAASRRV